MDKEELNTTTVDEPLLDRNTYRSIKKMDREELQGLIERIYEQGRQKGLSEAGVVESVSDKHNVLDLRELEKSIRAVPGMGAKRTEAVMVLIEQWMGVTD